MKMQNLSFVLCLSYPCFKCLYHVHAPDSYLLESSVLNAHLSHGQVPHSKSKPKVATLACLAYREYLNRIIVHELNYAHAQPLFASMEYYHVKVARQCGQILAAYESGLITELADG